MSRILFTVLSEKGHLHPFIGPAQALLARGHEVAFYAPCDVRAPLGRAGITLVFAGSADAPPPPDANRGRAFAELVADAGQLRAWIGAMLIDTVPVEVERLTALARELRPDVIVADPMFYAAPIVAARACLPWAGLSTSLNPVVPDGWTNPLIETARSLPRAALFARYGAQGRFRVCDCTSPHLNVVWSTRELVGDPPPEVTLVGASLPLAARGDESDNLSLDDGSRPLLYMSLGSQIYHQPRMFQVVAEAIASESIDAIFAMGELAGAIPLPPNARAVKYAPQLCVLARAAATITHGGANSVMEALAHGVPLLVSPICNDQHHNARFVSQSGAGITLDLAAAPVAEVRAAVRRLVAEGRERVAALRIAASYRALGGAELAATAILRLVA